MKKPSHWKLLDALTFGLAVPLALGIVIYFHINAVEGVPNEAWYLSYTVVAVFAAIYGRLVWLRKKYLDQFQWVPSVNGNYGFMVDWEDYVVDPNRLLDLVGDTVRGWEKAEPDWAVRDIIQANPIWVWFKKDLNERPVRGVGRPVKGYTIANGYDLFVDYDEDGEDMHKTAFEHELGHLIQGHATKDWTQDTHHERSKKHGLR